MAPKPPNTQLVAGLSSTIFAPLTASLIGQFGWRTSYLIMAGILAVVSVPLHAFFLNSTWSDTGSESTAQQSRTEIRQVTRTSQFITLQVVMTVATFTLFAVTINLIPLLIERGIDYSTAALAFGLVGAGQVIGRLGYPPLTRRTTPQQRTLLILAAGALGLWGLATIPGPTWLLGR
ncbi:MFS transporter [Dietzia kunjamensis]|uniref:MFS transporter n=1 Tax=Dietzia kunjamensis TaxID=322509 RepID=UPI0020968CEB|nr:MFS transporter [Dietzia kunjamensis]USX47803.1 MFS transporter [Dietzia kunjamensis]